MTRMRKWSLGTAFAVVLVLAAGWFLLISPKRSEAAELKAQNVQQLDANGVLRDKIAALKEQAKDLPAQEARLAEIRQHLPNNPGLPSMVRALDGIATKTGVEIVSLTPAVPEPHPGLAAAAAGGATAKTGAAATAPASGTTPATDATASTPAAVTAEPLQMIPFTIKVTGSYFDIEQFLNRIEDLTRSTLVTGFTIKLGDDGSSGAAGTTTTTTTSPTGELEASVSARVFYIPASAAAPAAATPAK